MAKSSYRAPPAEVEIEVGVPLRLDLPGGRSGTVQRHGSAVRVAIVRPIKRTETVAAAPISNFFVPVDCVEAIARAMCEAAAVPALPQSAPAPAPALPQPAPAPAPALPHSGGPRCPETGLACSTAHKHRRCRCAACVAWRRSDLAGIGTSDAFGSSSHRQRISASLKGKWPRGVHTRQHVRRGIVNPACPYCCPPRPDEQPVSPTPCLRRSGTDP